VDSDVDAVALIGLHLPIDAYCTSLQICQRWYTVLSNNNFCRCYFERKYKLGDLKNYVELSIVKIPVDINWKQVLVEIQKLLFWNNHIIYLNIKNIKREKILQLIPKNSDATIMVILLQMCNNYTCFSRSLSIIASHSLETISWINKYKHKNRSCDDDDYFANNVNFLFAQIYPIDENSDTHLVCILTNEDRHVLVNIRFYEKYFERKLTTSVFVIDLDTYKEKEIITMQKNNQNFDVQCLFLEFLGMDKLCIPYMVSGFWERICDLEIWSDWDNNFKQSCCC